MGDTTLISWTDHTFNPWVGCSKVHAGCLNCYAERDMDHRRHFAKWGPNGTRRVTSDANWKKPLKWNREAAAAGVRAKVFCASLADVFEDHEDLTMYREGLFDLIDETPNLDWQLLTKRPENILRMWPMTPGIPSTLVDFDEAGKATGYKKWERPTQLMFRPNCWLGTSISDQQTADKMIPELLKCHDLAPVLFLSCEPLLGPIDLDAIWPGAMPSPGSGPYVPSIDWAIIGGESGPNARPCQVQWIREIAKQCANADVPCFVKQLGSSPRFTEADIWAGSADVRRYDAKGGDPSEWPTDLRVRQFPAVVSRV